MIFVNGCVCLLCSEFVLGNNLFFKYVFDGKYIKFLMFLIFLNEGKKLWLNYMYLISIEFFFFNLCSGIICIMYLLFLFVIFLFFNFCISLCVLLKFLYLVLVFSKIGIDVVLFMNFMMLIICVYEVLLLFCIFSWVDMDKLFF